MITPDVTRFPGVYHRTDSKVYQFGLRPPDELAHHFPTGWADRRSLRTYDLTDANVKAKALHAEWALKFAALQKSDNPVLVDLTPALVTAIAAELRRWVLEADDNIRAFPDVPDALLAMEQRKYAREHGAGRQSLLIEVSARPAGHDPLSGLSQDERGVVARLNAGEEGRAAVDLAARNLRAVHPMVVAVAKSMGVCADWTSHAGREALLAFLKAYRTACGELSRRDAGEVIDTPSQAPHLPAHESIAPIVRRGKRMSDAFDAWKLLGTRKAKTSRVFAQHVAVFAELMGDPELATLRRADGARLRDALTRRAIKERNTAAAANNVLATIKALTNVAVDQEWLTSNPFVRLTVIEGGRKSEGREPWTPEDLIRLFDAPLFTGYVLPSGNAVTTKAGADAAYWVPLICLFTGARPSEVCQLWTDDLSVVDGHLIVEFREDLARGTSLKNPSSWRALPVHSELMRLGFQEYWESTRAPSSGPGWLFPAIPKRGANGAAGQFGQWFGEFKTAQGFDTPIKSLHSFRHTVETELAFAELSPTLADAITGHEGQGTGRKTYAATIRRQAVRLRPSLERLTYPGLNLPRVFKGANAGASSFAEPPPRSKPQRPGPSRRSDRPSSSADSHTPVDPD